MKNIMMINNVVQMDCYEEGKENRHFFIKFNVNTQEIIENSKNEYDIYAIQAVYRILNILKKGEPLPKECHSVWV